MGRPLSVAALCLAPLVLVACAGASGTPAGALPAGAASEGGPAVAQAGDSLGRRDRPGGEDRRASPSAEAARRWLLLGRSARGRAIRALDLGTAAGAERFLVVGCIHGDECAGIAIVQQLERTATSPQSGLLLLPGLNPDGRALGVRQNGRGVDLNRNFPSQWRPIGRRWDAQYSGPRPLSEPETRIARRLIVSTRPAVTIWYHQYWGQEPFVRAWGGSIPAGRRYARLAGIPFRRLPWPAGTAPNWQNHRFPRSSAFVVEFPRGPLDATAARRHAKAVLELTRPRGPSQPG